MLECSSGLTVTNHRPHTPTIPQQPLKIRQLLQSRCTSHHNKLPRRTSQSYIQPVRIRQKLSQRTLNPWRLCSCKRHNNHHALPTLKPIYRINAHWCTGGQSRPASCLIIAKKMTPNMSHLCPIWGNNTNILLRNASCQQSLHNIAYCPRFCIITLCSQTAILSMYIK